MGWAVALALEQAPLFSILQPLKPLRAQPEAEVEGLKALPTPAGVGQETLWLGVAA